MANNHPTSTAKMQQEVIFQAIRDHDLSKVQNMLNSCCIEPKSIKDSANKNNTLLHCAVEENTEKIVQELLLKK